MSLLFTEFNLDDALAVAREEAREDGREEGREEGITEANIKIAKNLLTRGSTPEFVQKITGLELDTLKGLQAGS